MTPDISVMRQEVSDLYSGPRWKKRVARMPDAQITAIYFREKKKREEEDAAKKKEQEDGGSDIPF